MPYDNDMETDKNLIGPRIPSNFIYGQEEQETTEDFSNEPKKSFVDQKQLKNIKQKEQKE